MLISRPVLAIAGVFFLLPKFRVKPEKQSTTEARSYGGNQNPEFTKTNIINRIHQDRLTRR